MNSIFYESLSIDIFIALSNIHFRAYTVANKKLIKSFFSKLYHKHKHEIPFNRNKMTYVSMTHSYKLHYL